MLIFSMAILLFIVITLLILLFSRLIMFKWIPGRQLSGYLKLSIINFTRFDIHILKYPLGSSVPLHIDNTPGLKHYRLNIILNSRKGGNFIYVNDNINYSARYNFVWFRPDIIKHGVSEILVGTRYVLSVGVRI